MDATSPSLEDVWNLSCLISGLSSTSDKWQASSVCSNAETISAAFERDLSLASLAPTMSHMSANSYAGDAQDETMMFAMELWNDEIDRRDRSFPASPVRATMPQKDHLKTPPMRSSPDASTSQFWPPQLELRGRQEEWQINMEVCKTTPKNHESLHLNHTNKQMHFCCACVCVSSCFLPLLISTSETSRTSLRCAPLFEIYFIKIT
jgi:hypothetical protein